MRLRASHLHACLADPVLDTMNFLNEVTMRFPRAISFAPGRPLERHFDSRRVLGEMLASVTATSEELDKRMQYGPAKGIICEAIAKMLRVDEKIEAAAEDIVITVGCQEAMFLAALSLRDAERQNVLLVAEPSYVGIVGASKMCDMPIEPVACGPDGLSLQSLRETIASVAASGKRVAAVYVCPDFSNPDGTTMPLASRRELLALAHTNDFLILEDNAYGMFAFDGERLPTLKSQDEHGHVVYLGTFSKLIFPGIRVGFMVAGQRVEHGSKTTSLADELGKLKSMITVNTPPASQLAVLAILEQNQYSLENLERAAIASYRNNRDGLLDALARHLPDAAALGISWNRPAGGFFLTVHVPFEVTDDLLRHSASAHEVIWVPMQYFYLRSGGERQIRLAFSYVDHDRIDEGIARFGTFLRETITAQSSTAPSDKENLK